MEIQDLEPTIGIDIERVGLKNVRKRVSLMTPKGPMAFDAELDLYISVSRDRRGAHLSRNVEALYEILSQEESHRSLEEYLDSLALKLLERHPYASRSVVVARTSFYVNVDYGGLTGVEPVNVEVEVSRDKGGAAVWSASVSVVGLTVCPSAQTAIASILGLDSSVAPSHMQRVILKGKVETMGEIVRIEKIAKALYKSLSAPAITLLKRPQEAELVLEAHKRPKLVEDVVREAIVNIASEISKLPDNTVIEVEALSMESIHPHNLYAQKRTTLGKLRREGELRGP
ncbi:MAG: GTP cyclohydrolase MptA [Thermoprotei archaeon]|nr:GTP cyclohydrolase MptA [Thermoprotei archaeon]